MDSCPVCGLKSGEKTILKKCTACLSVAYCSSECQRKHWKIHKENCSTFMIIYDLAVGHQLIATRDLKPGSLVFTEKPVLYSPAFTGSNWVCLSCGLDFNDPIRKIRSIRICSKCNWPICSNACEKNPIHAENECELFSNQNIPFPPSFSDILQDDPVEDEGDIEKGNLISKFIDIIRGLGWRKRDRKSYNEMMNGPYILEDEIIHHGKSTFQLIQKRVKLFERFVPVQDFQLDDDEELIRFMKQEPWNQFVAAETNSRIKRAIIHGTYLKASRMNHSCTPNCTKVTLPFPSLLIKIRTAVQVTRGQPLTINYMPNEDFYRQSRMSRHLEIQKMGWAFKCQCQRCLDPSELGTFMDAVVCPACSREKLTTQVGHINDGYLLPENPIDFDLSSLWRCTKCQFSIPFKTIEDNLDKIHHELNQIKYGFSNNQKKIIQIEKFIQDCVKLVHPNHHLILAASALYVQLFEDLDVNITKDELYKIKVRREFLLQIEDRIAPGISQVRGYSLFWLCYIISMRILHGDPTDFTEKEKTDLLNLALKFNKEAAIFFNFEKTTMDSHQANSENLALLEQSIRQALPQSTHRP